MLILDQAKVSHRNSRLEAEEVADKNSHHSEMTVYEKNGCWSARAGKTCPLGAMCEPAPLVPGTTQHCPNRHNHSFLFIKCFTGPKATFYEFSCSTFTGQEGEAWRDEGSPHPRPASIGSKTPIQIHFSPLTNILQRSHDQRRNRKASVRKIKSK